MKRWEAGLIESNKDEDTTRDKRREMKNKGGEK
jgi:hypothetical protein